MRRNKPLETRYQLNEEIVIIPESEDVYERRDQNTKAQKVHPEIGKPTWSIRGRYPVTEIRDGKPRPSYANVSLAVCEVPENLTVDVPMRSQGQVWVQLWVNNGRIQHSITIEKLVPLDAPQQK